MTEQFPVEGLARGLTTRAAESIRQAVGPNEPARRSTSVLKQLGASFASPLLGVLVVAAIASALLGETVNALIVLAMVILSGVIDFIQSFRSARAVEGLRARVAPTATVLRDGRWGEIARAELVPGDLIRLTAGDRVPADGLLVRATGLHVVEAALSGESLPVEKICGQAEAPGEISAGWVYTGTSIASGSAEAEVVRTGGKTRFGEIAARLAERPPESEFDRGLREFGLFITRTIFFLVLFILIVSFATHRPALQSVLFAVALAVGLTPEFLPMISTVTLAEGALRMARAKVIVKHLPAIQNLGSMDVLCSDKTGTITEGAVTVDASVDGTGASAPEALTLARENSTHQRGLASPLDAAILGTGTVEETTGVCVGEVPFDFERRRVSVALRRGDRRELVLKGAPESVMSVCSSWVAGGEDRPFDAAGRATCLATLQAMASRGLRVLAVARRSLATDETCSLEAERDLSLVGFLSFVDPPLPGVANIIGNLARDGVQVKIITGDDPSVARYVCGSLGLSIDSLLLGSEIERLTDPALAAVVERTSVFARVSPQQKTRILRALRKNGHVVGFLGDGINDAPSLHVADVGISVAHAVDVARDAADIVLLQPGLDVLHAGILEGRKAFGNVLKYLLMGTSSNFGNMFSMAGAALFLPFLPMLPTQILLNNFLYDLAQVTIPTDAVDPEYLDRPHRWDIGAVRRFMLVIGPISSLYDFLTFWVLLSAFNAPEALFHTGWFLESLATQVLVVFVIRTARRPWRSRPSAPLTLAAVGVLLVAVLLPWTPLAPTLGFVPMPFAFFGFLVVATLTYLAMVEWAKVRLLPHFQTRDVRRELMAVPLAS